MAVPEFLNITVQSDSDSFNVTANAGTYRCLVVWTYDIVDTVTAVTWGGDALTLIESETYDSPDQRVWIRAIGNAESNETKTLTVTSTNANNLKVFAMVYQYVNQTTPNQSQSLSSSESTNTSNFTGANMTYTGADALVVAYAQNPGNGTVSITNSGFTERGAITWGEITYIKVGDYTDTTSPAAVSVSNTVEVTNLTAGGVVLAGQKDTTVATTPLILAATMPNQTVTGNANTTVTPLALTATLPDQTASVETSTWTNKDKSTAPSWVNKDKS
jgi:hypothetical protein